MDIVDVAGEFEQRDRDAALARQMARAHPRVVGNGACVTCFNLIEPKRLAIFPNARHCAECARDVEHLAKRLRG